jgi:hypothetical protein
MVVRSTVRSTTSPATAEDIEVVAVVTLVAVLELPPQDVSNSEAHTARALIKKELALKFNREDTTDQRIKLRSTDFFFCITNPN